MDPRRFTAADWGEAKRRPGDKWAFWYFLPTTIPRDLPLAADTVMAMSAADAALGHLQGLGHLIKDPELLLGPYITREALASSRIEGTEASLGEVLQAEASEAASKDEDVLEVERYIRATRLGLDLIEELPLTQRLVKAVHRTLLSGVRGDEKLPGEFRHSPVWVGSPTNNPATAIYVPPLPDHLGDLFADWEHFVNEPCDLPVLVRCALMHYAFESIHPFLDGNGRIGRLLIGLMLIREGRLTTPLLYLSGYLETHRREYYDRLQAVRERGEIQEWMQFFFTAVRLQAEDAVVRAGQLVELREKYLAEAARARGRIGVIIDLAFSNPYLTVARVERVTGLTNQGARNLLRDAERRGWLHEIGTFGRGGRAYWVAHEVYRVIEAPNAYDTEQENQSAN